MKRKLAIMTSVGLAAGLVSGCGGGDNGSTGGGTPPPTSTTLTTLENLSLAEVKSETSSPFAVDNGAVTLSDTSETTEPVNINAM